MAWVNKYVGGYQSLQNSGTVIISEDDYAGSEIPIKIRDNSIEIRYHFNGWENPIIGLTASFSIVNDEEDFFTFMELITATEKQFKITITRETQPMFDGYIACDNSEQKYLRYQDIKLVGSSYLSKLQYAESPTVDILETDSFINIILDCLEQTGSTSEVRVNCKLRQTNGWSWAITRTLFSMTGIYKEIFWKNNIDRDSCLEILTKILTAFDCYIYWWDGYWYIERYADIWTDHQTYCVYTMGTSGGYALGDTAVFYDTNNDYTEFTDLIVTGANQTIGISQGMKEVEVVTKQIVMANLTLNDFSDNNLSAGTDPLLRTWTYYDSGGYFDDCINNDHNGRPYKNISNMIYRIGNWAYPDWDRGIYTQFKVTVDPETSLSIQFKFGTTTDQFPTSTDWSRWEIHFQWWLRCPVFGGTPYIAYDDYTDPDNPIWTLETSANRLQEITVSGTEFNASDLTVTVDISIPLGEVEGMLNSGGDPITENMTLCIATEYVFDLNYEETAAPANQAIYGDVIITATGVLGDNSHKGTINTDFINKTSIDAHFSDSENVNLKNTIWTGVTGWDHLTSTWTDGTTVLPLVQHKIRDKFRLYNISRQKLTATLYIPDYLNEFTQLEIFKPFTCFVDANQPGKYFVLVAYSYNLVNDEMKAQLMEYDNQETITIL